MQGVLEQHIRHCGFVDDGKIDVLAPKRLTTALFCSCLLMGMFLVGLFLMDSSKSIDNPEEKITVSETASNSDCCFGIDSPKFGPLPFSPSAAL